MRRINNHCVSYGQKQTVIGAREPLCSTLNGRSVSIINPRRTCAASSWFVCKIIDTFLWGIAKFGRDRDQCCKIDDVTIPYSNCSYSTRDSWFVSFSILVPTKNAKLLVEIGICAARYLVCLSVCLSVCYHVFCHHAQQDNKRKVQFHLYCGRDDPSIIDVSKYDWDVSLCIKLSERAT